MKKKFQSQEKVNPGPNELQELEHFIKARKGQNEALKKMLENRLMGDKRPLTEEG